MTPEETAGPDPGRPDPGTGPVRAALAALGPARMPDDVAARIRARLTDEIGAGPPPDPLPATGPARARRRPGRPVRAGLSLLATAAAAVLVAVPLTGGDRASDPVPVRTTGPLADELRAAAGDAGEPAGPLADPVRRHACLTAAGVTDPGAPLVAGRRHPVAGRPGVLLVLGTPVAGRFRIVVVNPECGPDGGLLLADLPAGS
ncbi:hypothetical protein ACLFMI_06420 [Pseudonocardia nantongensis]|uniref:hypothetical protein n=1 Tax=Pseudonocardia nantongensis TaxID=1181885 RepID=UPI00397E5069